MHKPTLIKVLKILKDYEPLDPVATRMLIEHVVLGAKQRDSSLDPKKLLAGAGL